jgi:hypothetical protein
MNLFTNPFIILAVQGVTFWPVWQWYVARLTDGSDEPWGVVALGTALLFLVKNQKQAQVSLRGLSFKGRFCEQCKRDSSFPRKRESRHYGQIRGLGPWMPAYAGMTGTSVEVVGNATSPR